ncbi:MAG: ribonuclease P protein component [Bacteroidales bacterium]|jgi:ribonuclease P protein component|nr:ribonuclease P protein component [Bacteroidales bacterium]
MEKFHKSERLCSRKTIALLFEKGSIFYTSLFKIVWTAAAGTEEYPARVAFSIPKKSFRKATERNLIRRRIREAYRKNKKILYEALTSAGASVAFIIIYRGQTIPDYLSVEHSMTELLGKLPAEVSKRDSKC